MRKLTEDGADNSRLAVRRFLHADTTACDFVGHFAQRGEGISWSSLQGKPNAQVISEMVEVARSSGEFAGIIFPEIGTDGDLAALVAVFAAHTHWSVIHDLQSIPGADVVRICWLRAGDNGDKTCSVLGMAPTLSMPVTRRAPYVSLFAWPGERVNEFREKPFPEIGIGDARPAATDREKYKAMRKKTESRAQQLNGRKLPPGATFILPAAAP